MSDFPVFNSNYTVLATVFHISKLYFLSHFYITTSFFISHSLQLHYLKICTFNIKNINYISLSQNSSDTVSETYKIHKWCAPCFS